MGFGEIGNHLVRLEGSAFSGNSRRRGIADPSDEGAEKNALG